MSKFGDFITQDRRLALLRLLVEARGECGESVLEKGLKALGHRVGTDRDAVRADLAFLSEAGCVVTKWPLDTVVVATITRRGVACSEGAVKVDGVAEPSIGC